MSSASALRGRAGLAARASLRAYCGCPARWLGGLVSTKVWLRISAIISLLFAVGHTLGGMQNWSPIADNPVLQSMRTVHFAIMGVNRSYLDFFMGFGYSLSVSMFLQSVLLWMLSNLARTHAAIAQPMIAAFAVAAGLGGLIAWRYIFPVPALFALVLFAVLVVAFASARRDPAVCAPSGA